MRRPAWMGWFGFAITAVVGSAQPVCGSAGPGTRAGGRAAAAAVGRGNPALLRTDRQARRAGGGQRLRLARRPAVDLALLLRPVLPALLRRPGFRTAEPARPAFARLRRLRRRVGRHRHQQPRRRQCRPDQGGAVGPARVRLRGRAQGRADGSRRAPDEGGDRALPDARFRRFGSGRGRRPGARHRRPLRCRPDGDQRHRLGIGPHASQRLRLPVLHPDRRRHQSRQFRRGSHRHGRSPRRHQFGDLLAVRRVEWRRLRNSLQHGARRRCVGAERRARAPALGRRQLPGAHLRYRRGTWDQGSARRAGRRHRQGQPGLRRRAEERRPDHHDRRGCRRRSVEPQLPAGDQGHRRDRQARHPPRGQGLCRHAGAGRRAGKAAPRSGRRSAAVRR